MGVELFDKAVTDVHVLHTTYRFKDSVTKEWCPFLPRILAYIRNPNRRPMPDELWNALEKREARGPEDKRLFTTKAKTCYDIGIQWEAVARMMQLRAKRDAVAAGQLLIYVHAVDQSSIP